MTLQYLIQPFRLLMPFTLLEELLEGDRQDTSNVIIGDDQDEEEEQDESHLLCCLTNLHIDGTAQKGFGGEEQDVASIQDGYARTTPGLAVGLMFIPVFNIYWQFVALKGLAEDFWSILKKEWVDTGQFRE